MSPQPNEGPVEAGPCSPSPRSHAEECLSHYDCGHNMLRHFSHRCRDSLSGIKLGLYLVEKELKGPSLCRWNDLARTYEGIEKLFDGLPRVYQSTSLTLVRSPLGQL